MLWLTVRNWYYRISDPIDEVSHKPMSFNWVRLCFLQATPSEIP
jgi:hypothetical protein